MKKIFVIFLCICYVAVCFGITFQIHRCADNVLWVLSEVESIHHSCPFCHQQDAEETKKDCRDGSCDDMEFKLDQLSDKVFSYTKDRTLTLDPAIRIIPWMQDIFSFPSPQRVYRPLRTILAFGNSSPPIYLQHCIFRI